MGFSWGWTFLAFFALWPSSLQWAAWEAVTLPWFLLPVLCSLAFSSFLGQATSCLSVFWTLRACCPGTFLSHRCNAHGHRTGVSLEWAEPGAASLWPPDPLYLYPYGPLSQWFRKSLVGSQTPWFRDLLVCELTARPSACLSGASVEWDCRLLVSVWVGVDSVFFPPCMLCKVVLVGECRQVVVHCLWEDEVPHFIPEKTPEA